MQDSRTIDDALILGKSSLAFGFANKYSNKGVLYDDLLIAATTGIISAVKSENYDISKPFNSYMYTSITREVLETIRLEGSNITIAQQTAFILRAAAPISETFIMVNERPISRDELREALIKLGKYPETAIDLALSSIDLNVLAVDSLDTPVEADSEEQHVDMLGGDYIDERSIANGAVRRRVRQILAANGLGTEQFELLNAIYGMTREKLKFAEITRELGVKSVAYRRDQLLSLLANDAELQNLQKGPI